MAERKTSKTHSNKTAPPAAHPHGDSRAALLSSAVRVFARNGFEGTTVKDLADDAGVNVSLVSYYFGGKEGLYRTCIENFGLERVAEAERILKAAGSREEFKLRLRLFAESFIEIHLQEPEMLKLVQRALDVKDTIARDLFNSVFVRIFTGLVLFLKSAQETQFIRQELDIEITASLLFGSLLHMIRSDEMCKWTGRRTLNDSTFKESFIEHWLNQNTTGFFIQDKSS